MTLLAIDYGLKNSGIAIAHTPIAEPLYSVSTKDLVPAIKTEINLHLPDLIIVGIPTGKIAINVKEFIQSLSQETKVPISTHPETLSSKEAFSKIKHKKKTVRSGSDHHFAAAVILQDYLDSKSSC